MVARKIVGGLADAAVGAVKHPVGTAGEAISKAKGVVSAGTAVAGSVVGKVRGGPATKDPAGATKETVDKAADATKETVDKAADATKETVDKAADATKETVDKAADATKETVDKAADATKETVGKAAGTAKATTDRAAEATKVTTDKAADAAKSGADKAAGAAAGAASTAKKAAKKAPTKKAPAKSTAKKAGAKPKKAAAKREPQVVMAEPAPPPEPPIDVVGQALATEAKQDTTGFGRTTEPRGASRDEEHGDAALQRAESDEIAEEMAEVARAGNLDLSTPVGTTGADTGFNPDTAEADLQQPGTEPLLDPSLTKEVKSEQDTLHQASDPEKG